MKVGYVRCSTVEQNEARQMVMMEEQKVEKIYIDKKSGKDTDREQFKEMMLFLRSGDTLVVESISRVARNTRDLLKIVSELTEKHALPAEAAPATQQEEKTLWVKIPSRDDPLFEHIRLLLTMFPGNERLILYCEKEKKKIGARCLQHEALIEELCELCGADSVKVR